MPYAVPVKDVFAMRVPPKWHPQAEVAAATGELPDDLREELERLANATIYRQYTESRGLKALLIGQHDWLVTGDPATVEAYQPGDGCPACIAGNDQALATLRENPGALIVLGNLNYTEVWTEAPARRGR